MILSSLFLKLKCVSTGFIFYSFAPTFLATHCTSFYFIYYLLIVDKDDLLLLSFHLPTEYYKCFDPLPFLYCAFSSEVFPVIAFKKNFPFVAFSFPLKEILSIFLVKLS